MFVLSVKLPEIVILCMMEYPDVHSLTMHIRLQVFKQFHAAYVDAVSNPFHDVNNPISSAKFAAKIKAIVDGCQVDHA